MWKDGMISYYVLIENFNLYVPKGTAIKIFIKIANFANWIELLNNVGDKYGYYIPGGSSNMIEILSFNDYENENIPLDVKITF